MNILYLKNTRGYHIDLLEVLIKRGHTLLIEEIPDKDEILLQQLAENKDYSLMPKLESNNWDIVFSLDYYPCISMICKSMNKYYVSWNLEPPFSNLYSSSVANPTNLIFTADKWLAQSFNLGGIEHIFYLPEGVNLDRCNRVKANQTNHESKMDCSFIGDMQNHSWQSLFQTQHLLDATLGYLDGLLASQNFVYGRDFYTNTLPAYLYKDLLENSKIRMRSDSVQNVQEYFADQVFYPKTTAVDRIIAVKALTQATSVNLYTDDMDFEYENVINHGVLPYEKRLEAIENSHINVSITPRGFKDGIYGHALQIMGMGGFLITDYRPALEEEFVPGEDFIIYDDMLHLAGSAIRYLNHIDERVKMTESALAKIKEKHLLEHRIEFIEKQMEMLF